jgi:hypothetical protein
MFTDLANLARRMRYSRTAVDWLLRSDIGEVIKTIVDDDEKFPDYALPKNPNERKVQRRKTRSR